jgi:signal transduction histidine kinase
MAVSVEADTVSDTLSDSHNTCVYRVVQEALHNCTRHAHARTVRIRVRQEPGHIVLSVQDDGKGFDARHVRGLGLVGMEERVNHLGGSFQVKSEPGHGTMLVVELPLTAAEPSAPQPETVAHGA